MIGVSGLTSLANFEDDGFAYFKILNWADSDTGGGLPYVSALPFAHWLNNAWNDFDDGEGKLTNEDVLKGALDHWTGKS